MPSCFVIMPFGKKKSDTGEVIDFDEIYKELIRKAAVSAGLDAADIKRGDEAGVSGLVQKNMINEIATADVCIVDLSLLNANVFYELGVRHALRRRVTVLIKHEMFRLPFNIGGMRTISYNLDNFDAKRDEITLFIRNGLEGKQNDSLVFEVVPQLNVTVGTERAAEPRNVRYRFKGRSKPRHAIGIISGDLRRDDDIRGIPVWVNSENTNMQMARFYDRSISSTIRYLGAKKDALGHIGQDVIAEDLTRQMTSPRVNPATVFETTPGDLIGRDVQLIMHVAAVEGTVPGGGYKAVENIGDCVTRVLTRLADNPQLAAPAVLFPLLGTGMGAGNAEDIVPKLISAAVNFLQRNANADLDTIWFLAYTESQWALCEHALKQHAGLLGKREVWKPPPRTWKRTG